MNKLTLIGFILLGTCLAAMPLGAQKYDHSWLLGYLPNDSSERFGGTLLTFGEDTIYSKFKELTFSFDANAQICDSSGRLKLVSDGCNVFNSNLEKINSEPLGYNEVFNQYCSRGYPLSQGLIILPNLYNNKEFFLFRVLYSENYLTEALLYWKLNEIGSNHFTIAPETRLIEDEVADQITATQHGNGMDWWIIAPRIDRGYHITRIGKNGPEESDFYKLKPDPIPGWIDNGASLACFSPDGNTYISSSGWAGVRIYDFDRCEGILSNARFIPLSRDTASSVGVAVSPNNKWLYLAFSEKIYQYDLHSVNIASSGIKVAEYDGHMADIWTTFFQMMLTPNDRIIVSSTNTVYELAQIMNPNERGLACDVQQHSLSLNTRAQQQLPNFPNFRAGRLKGSPCDTLLSTSVRPIALKHVRVYPNPALDQFEVEMPGGYDRLELFDMHGRLVLAQERQGLVEVSGMPEGIYTVRVWQNRQLVGVGKIAVMR